MTARRLFERRFSCRSFDTTPLDRETVETILEAARVPGTDKLIKLSLDTGMDRRTVVSGIAAYFDPEKLAGKKVCLLANLEPRKIRGIASQGMILLAEDNDGRLVFVSPEEDVINGSEVK